MVVGVMTLLEQYRELITRLTPVDTRQHLPYLRSVAKGIVLEIGCDVGNSTTALLLGVEEHGGHVYSVDINPACANNFVGYHQWTFIHSSSREIANVLTQIPDLDVLYVDGDHSYEGAKFDIDGYGCMVREGGLILVHDVEHPDFPGVRQALDEYEHGQEQKFIRSGSWGLGVIVV